MKPHDISEKDFKLREFSFSVVDMVMDWLYYLPPNSIMITHIFTYYFVLILDVLDYSCC